MNKWKLKQLVAELHPKYGHEWADEGKCVGEDTDMFIYPSSMPTRSQRHKLEKICASCPVMLECRYEAVRNLDEGWWGGMDEKQRMQWAEEELFSEVSIRSTVSH